MFDFFNEFFQSDLVKNNIVTVIAIAVLLIVIGAGLMWLYMTRIYMKSLGNENTGLKKENEKIKSDLEKMDKEYTLLKERLEALIASSKRLKFMDEQHIARNTETTDSALDEFLRK